MNNYNCSCGHLCMEAGLGLVTSVCVSLSHCVPLCVAAVVFFIHRPVLQSFTVHHSPAPSLRLRSARSTSHSECGNLHSLRWVWSDHSWLAVPPSCALVCCELRQMRGQQRGKKNWTDSPLINGWTYGKQMFEGDVCYRGSFPLCTCWWMVHWASTTQTRLNWTAVTGPDL